MNDGELTFAITFGMVYFTLSCCWLVKYLNKSRRSIRPFGISRFVSNNSNINPNSCNFSSSSNQISFTGRVLVDNYVNSNIDLPIENAHVIIQILPEPITVPPVAVGIPIQQNYKLSKNE